MAKVYSWEVSINPYAYAYIVHPNDTERAYVGTELKGNNLQKVIDWVAECSDEDYIEHFNMVKELCEEKNYSVKFENVNAYMDVNTSCDNLRGPAGKGIINITLTNSTELADTYTINYTDGTNTSFVVRHGKPGGSGGTGDTEDVSVSTYFAMIYTSGRDENGEILGEVTTPTGGTYDWIEYELTPPIGWQESDSDNEGNALEPPVWMSSKTFIKGHEEEGGWSTPTMISGENGKPGVDGASLEFIYTQASKKPNTPTENDKNIPGFVPTTEGWYPSPKGVDEDNRREWFTTRLYDNTKETWGDWNTPAIWSQYGVNGQDGDGVEYIYYLSNNATPPDNPTPSGYTSNDEYQQDEWTPSKMGKSYDTIKSGITIDEATAQKWKDNPTGVDGTNQWEWVAVRKYSGKDKKWGPFSDPSLWSKYGEDGQPGANATIIRKVYKMTDSTNEVPDPPTDNLYTDWNNAFPVDYTIDQCVWCCEAEIWANNNEFVQKYRKLSKSEITTEIEINAIGVGGTSVPTQKIEPEGDYIKMMYSGEYYVWDEGGWSKPYLVTGTKGVDATPMAYVTYVFYYGDRNNTPEAGETGKKLNEIITNKIGGWFDFPKDYTDSPTECWYQCCLSMNPDNTIESWGGIHPCNGKDGEALPGKYTEFRFAVTNNDSDGTLKEPKIIDRTEREPKGWVTTKDENFPTLGVNQTMWQIFAVINPNGNNGSGTTEVVEGEWQGPIQVSAENGKDGAKGDEGPAGKQGVSGIPGANFKVKYCLGTFSEKTGECYWKSDDIEPNKSFDTYAEIIEYSNVSSNKGKTVRLNTTTTYLSKTYYAGLYYIKGANNVEQIKGWDNDPAIRKPYGSGYFGKDPSKFNDLKSYNYWFDFPPNSEIIKFDQSGFTGKTESGKDVDYKTQPYEGRVIRRKLGNSYVLSFIYYHEDAKVYTNQDITTTTLTLEEAENFHVYVWCVQGTEKWTKGESVDSDGNLIDENIPDGIEWGIPFKIQGTNGLNGLKGADGRSQTVYPMGVYNSNEVYLTTESKAPYVYDANDSNFYVLNRVNEPWVGDLPDDFKSVIIHPSVANSENTDKKEYLKKDIPSSKQDEKYDFIIVTDHKEYIRDAISGTTDECTSSIFYYQWNGSEYKPASYYKYAYGGEWIKVSQDGTTPCQNYQNNIINNHKPAWVKFESFEALYTSIGIIENGMIGSAVYNNEFMFSQQGIDESGYTTNYATESAKGNGGFLSGYEYDKEEKKWKYKNTNTFISDDEVNPYEMKVTPTSTTPVHSFRPNITLNFKTGQAYLSTGEITFGNGVMTAHTGIFNNVVVNGTYNTQVLVINEDNKGKYIYNDYLLLSNVPDIVIFEELGDMTLKLPYYYPVYYHRNLFDEDTIDDKYVFHYVNGQDGILGKVPSGKESQYAEVSDYAKISVGNLCYYTDYGYKKEGEKYVINNLTDVRSYIGREMYFFNKSKSGKITIECGEVFTKNEELGNFVRVSSVNYNSEWILPTISASSMNDLNFIYDSEDVGKDDRLYEKYIMHAKHPAMIGNKTDYNQDKLVIPSGNLCFAKCDIGNYTYMIKNKNNQDVTYRNSLLGWRFNMVDDNMSDIYYNDSYLKTVYIYNNNTEIHKFNVVLDWTWNTYLSSSFNSSNFTYDDANGYVKYKHTDGKYYYLLDKQINQNPTFTADLNRKIIYSINGQNNYYLSTRLIN